MSAARSAAPPPPRLYVDAVPQPYRALGSSGFRLSMTVVGGASPSAGTGFLVIGAWPVCGFLDREPVVRRTTPGAAVGEWRFQPYWLRVALDEPPRRDSRLTLSSHGRRLAIGSFLAPEERHQLARALRAALEHQRAPAGRDRLATVAGATLARDCCRSIAQIAGYRRGLAVMGDSQREKGRWRECQRPYGRY